ncbi:MAG: hypothetical protein KDJ52_03910 [Anaerolineae bacterium]|nr:hypothetical protein [Anaerolineae bacterium]
MTEQRVKQIIHSQIDRGASAFVWGIWLVMLLTALIFLVTDTYNIPFSEDWWLVPPLTGNEPNLLQWLWAQNNEHRIPFPRIILLLLLKVTHGDFRTGMLLNIVILSSLAFISILVIRYIRGGRTHYTDAFFAIALLHLGNWENMYWSWQITQIIPTVLTCIILLVIVSVRHLFTWEKAIIGGISLILLPLSGANGLIFVPGFVLWFGYSGVRQWRLSTSREGKVAGAFLVGMTIAALGLAGLYFVGYQSPPSEAPNPTVRAALWASLQFLALGFGPVARSSWILSTIIVFVVLAISIVILAFTLIRLDHRHRYRAFGVLVFLGNMMLFALAIGWGRAEVLHLPVWGGIWPTRYVLLAVPALFTTYFIWELYTPAQVGKSLQWFVFGAMFLLIPLNTVHGFWWQHWYAAGAGSLEQDLREGLPLSTVADRNREFLFRWMDSNFNRLRMLRDAQVGLFANISPDPVEIETSVDEEALVSTVSLSDSSLNDSTNFSLITQEFHYNMSQASEVELVWGINGWQTLPDNLWPIETNIIDNVMHTPMTQEGDTFVVKVEVPVNSTIDYCFLLIKSKTFDVTWPMCDGNYQDKPSFDGLVEVNSQLNITLNTQEIRYVRPEATEVNLLWGINGWQPMPEALWPPGTEFKNNIMYTPMTKKGDTFIAKVKVPVDTTFDYGFQITKRQGLFDIIYPVWDGNYQSIPTNDGMIKTVGTVSLLTDVSDALTYKLYFLAAGITLLAVWFSGFLFFGFFKDRDDSSDVFEVMVDKSDAIL